MKGSGSFVEQVTSSSQIQPFKERGASFVQLFIAHGQKNEAMAEFLYSTLDVPVYHSFFMNTAGDLNMRNFQRFHEKAHSESITILNTQIKSLQPQGYERLRSLILVSCGLTEISLAELANVEYLDIRFNRVTKLPDNLSVCRKMKTLRVSHNKLKRLTRSIGALDAMTTLDVSHNSLRRITSSVIQCKALEYLECDHNDLLSLPVDIGLLSNLLEIRTNNNKLAQLPLSIYVLKNLKRIDFKMNPLTNIPPDFKGDATEVREYLKAVQQDPIANNVVKLVLVGQEGVGKTTLLKALKRTNWVIPKKPKPEKTDGIDVKDIHLGDITMKCFDCGGDVDFNETHNFFITQGALYIACFNMSEYCKSMVERNSFLLGRLQLWLQYIFSKVPSARVLIVGTHADHPALKGRMAEEIQNQVRELLVSARVHHHQYFQKEDRHKDCLICHSDSKCLKRQTSEYENEAFESKSSLDDDDSDIDIKPSRLVCFPHIVGFYEISSVKAMGNSLLQINNNQSLEDLKDAIKDITAKMVAKTPQIPRKWADVLQSLQNHIEVNPNNCISNVAQVTKLAAIQGVKNHEIVHMLNFFKAQGHVLFFPKTENLDDLVILDPEWLAKIFATVVSFRDTGINNEGFINRDKLEAIASRTSDDNMRGKVLELLHYFGLCISIHGTNTELFPCKLPMGEPDDIVWSSSPQPDERQITYSVTFPSLVPPPLFSDLIVAIYRERSPHEHLDNNLRYFSNVIVDNLKLDKIGCKICGQISMRGMPVSDHKPVHRINIELVPHKRVLFITVRGTNPCCMMKRINKILNKVSSKYEGLGTIQLDTIICPGCLMQRCENMHRFSSKLLMTDTLADLNSTESIQCVNSHTVHDQRGILLGMVHESCMPYGTIRPRTQTQIPDFSGCPRLFVVLPVNKDGLTFDNENKMFVSSLLYDGFGVHLLCEFPDGYHLCGTPGYRLNKPKDFMSIFGSHVIAVLRLLCYMAESTVSPQYASSTKDISKRINDLIKDLKSNFSNVKEEKVTENDSLMDIINRKSSGFDRSELKRFLHIADKPANFGPLRRLNYQDQKLWLCSTHFKQLRSLPMREKEDFESAA